MDLGGVRCHPHGKWRQFVLEEVISKIPEIPVLRSRILAIALGGVVLSSLIPSMYMQKGKWLLAGALETLARSLRR